MRDEEPTGAGVVGLWGCGAVAPWGYGNSSDFGGGGQVFAGREKAHEKTPENR